VIVKQKIKKRFTIHYWHEERKKENQRTPVRGAPTHRDVWTGGLRNALVRPLCCRIDNQIPITLYYISKMITTRSVARAVRAPPSNNNHTFCPARSSMELFLPSKKLYKSFIKMAFLLPPS